MKQDHHHHHHHHHHQHSDHNFVVDDGDEDGRINNEETSVTVANGQHSFCHMDCAKDDRNKDDNSEYDENAIVAIKNCPHNDNMTTVILS